MSVLKAVVEIAIAVLLVTASTVGAEEKFSPEILYKETVETWQRNHKRRSPTSWEVWKEFATTITSKYETIIGKDGTAAAAAGTTGPSAVEIVGALEEGILTIERIVFREQESSVNGNVSADDAARDVSLAVLYKEYGRLLLYSSETTTTNTLFGAHHRCHELAKDPHTLLIGAPERLNDYSKTKNKKMHDDDDDDKLLLASLFGPLCRDNAENALRNAISLDASSKEADRLLEDITGLASNDTVHTRKPKEFVAELFDAFADSFDEKLTKTLEYRVPQIIGSKVGEILVLLAGDQQQQQQSQSHQTTVFRNVLDAGCGTGLAGRELRKAIDERGSNNNERIMLVGVDASPKMLEIAKHCTTTQGCGLPSSDSATDPTNDPELYDALIDLDLEEMTLANTLMATTTTTTTTQQQQQQQQDSGFDLIVAADVFVYFGSLEIILRVFSGLQQKDGILVFTCELATPEEAPMGYRLLPTGRFAHTKDHTVNAASAVGYSLRDYSEIVPRTEKGVAVDGHLFVFQHIGGETKDGEL